MCMQLHKACTWHTGTRLAIGFLSHYSIRTLNKPDKYTAGTSVSTPVLGLNRISCTAYHLWRYGYVRQYTTVCTSKPTPSSLAPHSKTKSPKHKSLPQFRGTRKHQHLKLITAHARRL